jgi:N-acyl amino acid synthase of PEP-CTERM/exosortase system
MSIASPFERLARASGPAAVESGIYDLFKRHLSVVAADTEALLDQVFRLRYQVYCVERGFENAAEHPDGRERDHDDGRSLHFLVLDRASGEAAGTVRLILPQIGSELPVIRLARNTGGMLPAHSTAEVSRFAVTKAFRRPLATSWSSARDRRSGLPIIAFGLIQAIVMMSAVGGITHIVAMMEPALLRLLRRMSIEFYPVGGLVEHHGLRQPGWAAMGHLCQRVKECHRELWEIATDAGRQLPALPGLAAT